MRIGSSLPAVAMGAVAASEAKGGLSAQGAPSGLWDRVESACSVHLDVQVVDGKAALLRNTTGDMIDAAQSVIVPKQGASTGTSEDGKKCLMIGRDEQGQPRWLPLEVFQQTPGENGVYYLPTYKGSKVSGAIGGAIRGLAAMGPAGAVTGAATGLLSQFVPTDSTLVKTAAGSAMGGAMLVGLGALYGAGGADLASLGFAGAMVGAAGALAGDGDSRVRDASFGGTILGIMSPDARFILPLAAAVGAKAKNPFVAAAVSATVAAGLSAAQTLFTGAPLTNIAVAAALGAASPGLGRVTMNLCRNGASVVSKEATEVAAKVVPKLGDKTLYALAGAPVAFTGVMLGQVVGPAGSIVLGVAGEALGAYQAYRWLHKPVADEKVAA